MCFKIMEFIISIATFIALVIYAYFTYLIAKDTYEPYVSFFVNQIPVSSISPSPSHLGFNMSNKSKVEVEIFCKLWSKLNDEIFEFKNGFYGNNHQWILQPFTNGHGHFELKDISNKKGINLSNFLKKNNIPSLRLFIQIKYRKVGSKKWKKPSPQKYIYNFENNQFWLDV